MSGFAILLLIVTVIWLFWPVVSRWLRRKAAEKTEDYIRNAMGMPPRPGSSAERRQRRAGAKTRNNGKSDETADSGDYRGNSYNRRQNSPLIPKEYAEDVEFVETKDYSSTSTVETPKGVKQQTFHESQVSDAEWTDIK